MVAGPGRPARRRSPSDAAVPRAGCRQRARGCDDPDPLPDDPFEPGRAFALYQRTRGPRARLITEQTARRGDRYLGEPTANSLQGEDQGPQYAYDAVSGPLGG